MSGVGLNLNRGKVGKSGDFGGADSVMEGASGGRVDDKALVVVVEDGEDIVDDDDPKCAVEAASGGL